RTRDQPGERGSDEHREGADDHADQLRAGPRAREAGARDLHLVPRLLRVALGRRGKSVVVHDLRAEREAIRFGLVPRVNGGPDLRIEVDEALVGGSDLAGRLGVLRIGGHLLQVRDGSLEDRPRLYERAAALATVEHVGGLPTVEVGGAELDVVA